MHLPHLSPPAKARLVESEGSSTSMTDASIVDFNANFMCSRRPDFDFFDGEVLSCLPRYSCLLGCKVAQSLTM